MAHNRKFVIFGFVLHGSHIGDLFSVSNYDTTLCIGVSAILTLVCMQVFWYNQSIRDKGWVSAYGGSEKFNDDCNYCRMSICKCCVYSYIAISRNVVWDSDSTVWLYVVALLECTVEGFILDARTKYNGLK